MKTISTNAFFDTGALRYEFIDEEFAGHYSFDLFPLNTPRELEVIDRRPVASRNITHLAHLGLDINVHKEHASYFLTRLGYYSLILGIPWMKHHEISISFSSNQISFASEKCKRKCISSALPVTTTVIHPEPNTKLDICMIGATLFLCLTRKKMVQLFSVSLHAIKSTLGVKEKRDLREIVIVEYHDLLSLFSETRRKNLPPHRKYHLQINLKEGKNPLFDCSSACAPKNS